MLVMRRRMQWFLNCCYHHVLLLLYISPSKLHITLICKYEFESCHVRPEDNISFARLTCLKKKLAGLSLIPHKTHKKHLNWKINFTLIISCFMWTSQSINKYMYQMFWFDKESNNHIHYLSGVYLLLQ